MRKYVWAYPVIAMVAITFIAMFLQSCGVVKLDKMNQSPTIYELDKKLRQVQVIWGFTLITGVAFCLYMHSEIKKLEAKITKLTIYDNE